MKKYIALKLINFGLWIYENSGKQNWDSEDYANYKKLSDLKIEMTS